MDTPTPINRMKMREVYGDGPKDTTVTVPCTRNQKAEFVDEAKRRGFDSLSAFARAAMAQCVKVGRRA